MNALDFKTCSEEELWRYVAWHLEGAGIRSILVGGAVVAIYTEGLYRSGDLDMVPDDFQKSEIPRVMEGIGFMPGKSRHYRHPDCQHLFIEFPPGPVELGDEYPITPDEIPFEGRTIRLLSPTDCVKDRLAAYIHWKRRACYDQARLVCLRQKGRVDLENVGKWCEKEGGSAAFRELIEQLAETETRIEG